MIFPSARELDPDEVELVALATRTIDDHTDAGPDGDGLHTVGAAVLAGDHRTYAGVNLYHFTGGPCAELVALGAARAQGAREIVAIVAVGNGGRGVLAPCGRDRQVLSDYYPRTRVIVSTPEGLRSVTCADLLPGGYRAHDAVEEPMVDAPQVLEFSANYLDAVRTGRKTRTTRECREAVPGPAVLVFETEPPTRLTARVVGLRETLFADLGEDDARAEDCAGVDELRRLLRTHYPQVRDDQRVWVVDFELC